MVSRKPTAGSLMVTGTSFEDLRGQGEAERLFLPRPPSRPQPCPRPCCRSHRFSTTTTAEPSGRTSATVSKSFFSLAASPTRWEPSGMNLLGGDRHLRTASAHPSQGACQTLARARPRPSRSRATGWHTLPSTPSISHSRVICHFPPQWCKKDRCALPSSHPTCLPVLVWADVSRAGGAGPRPCGRARPHSPEVAEVVEHGLFVERVLGDVYDDGAVDEVAHPVGAPFGVQGQVPVGPAGHVVEEVLG